MFLVIGQWVKSHSHILPSQNYWMALPNMHCICPCFWVHSSLITSRCSIMQTASPTVTKVENKSDLDMPPCFPCYLYQCTFIIMMIATRENIQLNLAQSWIAFLHKNVSDVQYIPRNMHTVFALLCFVVVIHWLIFPYPSGLLHWHCGNLTIAPVPAKQPWWIWINTSCEFIMNHSITTTKQSTTKPCAYFLRYTVSSVICPYPLILRINGWEDACKKHTDNKVLTRFYWTKI